LNDDAKSSHVGQLFSNSAGKSSSRMGRLRQLFRSEHLSQEDSGDLIESSGNILDDIHQPFKYHGVIAVRTLSGLHLRHREGHQDVKNQDLIPL
jgi:hypothetical protein